MMRAFLTLATVLVLVIASPLIGGARGAPDAVDHAVICAGQDVVLVYLDAHGKPTVAPPHCLDCALVAFTVVPQHPALDRDARTARTGYFLETHVARARLTARRATARAPPILV